MKKQIFLLSVALLFSTGAVFSTSCGSSCNTSCATSCNTDCSTLCTPEHGHTFLQVTPHFQAASPELVSAFNSNVLYNLEREDKHGAFQVEVFGGQSTKCNAAAAYYLPYGHQSLTFDGSVTSGTNLGTFAAIAAESDVLTPIASTKNDEIAVGGVVAGGTSTTSIATDAATYFYDTNKDTSKILPWNFGITFAALFEPRGVNNQTAGTLVGTGLVTSPAFKSTICPTLKYSHVGAGFALRYHFSDDKNGWFGLISTAVQNVRSKFSLNENVQTEAQALDNATWAAGNPDGDATPTSTTLANANASVYTFANSETTAANTVVPSIREAYFATTSNLFPTAQNETNPPANVEEAFAQDAWNYGKVCGCSKITRLADIELSLGYQWMCGDCASTNWYLGVVIPTGNKGGATYIAPAVVGNGQHAGIMTGSCTEVMLSEEADYSAWYRIDACARYLFRNTQKRSFDLLGNEWSRYMMVWENEDAYTTAVTAMNVATPVVTRAYTPGINVFTTDFYIKPQFQGRLNQAVYFQGEHFRAELGWNVFARQTDCVQLACEWTQAPAFADSSYIAGMGLNNHRTIYNDAQTASVNQVTDLARINATPAVVTLANVPLAATNYDDFAITSDEIDYNSVATPGVITNTPYLVLGYAFESDYKPQLSVGGSYEFTTSNRALNQWLVWGKFEIAF